MKIVIRSNGINISNLQATTIIRITHDISDYRRSILKDLLYYEYHFSTKNSVSINEVSIL